MAKPNIKGPSAIDAHVGSRLRKRRRMLGMNQEKLGRSTWASLFSKYRSTKEASTAWALAGFSRPPIFSVLRCHSFFKAPTTALTRAPYRPPTSTISFQREEGQRLARAFMRIQRSALRLVIVKLVQEIVGDDGD